MKKLAAAIVAILILVPTLAVIAFGVTQPALFEAALWRAFWTFVAFCGVVIAILIAVLHNRRERRERTYMDGALPLMKRRRRIWRSEAHPLAALWFFLVGDEFYIDPNRMAAAGWHIDPLGQMAEMAPAAGWQVQHEYNLAVEGTNKARAIAPGDETWRHLFGRHARPEFPSARVLNPKPPKPIEPAGLIGMNEDPPPHHEPLPDIGTALQTYRGPTVYLGQNDEDVALWNPRTDPHLGVWGKSGSGKTTRAGLTVALAQIVQGYRVIVIDPDLENGTSVWRSLSPWAQVITPGEPGCTLWDEIMQWYEARRAKLEQTGVSENYQLARPLTPLAIHFEEFVRWRDRCKARGGADKKHYDHVVDCLSEIAQRGRKPGCHLTVYGQLPGELPETIAGNLVGVTFKQNANQGNKVGHWGAHQLGVGEFAYEGSVYNSFQPVADVPRLLGGRTPRDYIVSPTATVPNRSHVAVPDPVPEPVSVYVPEVDTLAGNAGNDGNGNKWEAFARDWRDQNPTGGPSALARAMCEADGNVKPYTDYKSEAARRLAAIDAERPTQPPTALDTLRAMGFDPFAPRSSDERGANGR